MSARLRAALRARLLQACDLPDAIAWENRPFTRPASGPWLEESLRPGPITLAAIGPSNTGNARPLYSLTVNVPATAGTELIDTLADAIAAVFAPGQSFGGPVADGGGLLQLQVTTCDVGPVRLQADVASRVLTIGLEAHSLLPSTIEG